MTDFEARRGEFDWRNTGGGPGQNDTRTRFMERITTICQQRTIIGLGCAIVREQCEHILTGIQGDLRHPFSPSEGVVCKVS